MSAPHDPDVVLASWLDDGPADLPSSTRRAISTAVRTTPQARARRLGLPVWRRPISRSVTLAATAALVAVALGLFVVAGGPGAVLPSGGTATPSAPAPTPAGGLSLDWTTWQDFTSARYGYSARYPTGWTATPATRDWSPQLDQRDWNGPTSDTFIDATPGVRATPLSAFSVDVDIRSLNDWIQRYLGPADPGVCPVTDGGSPFIDGHPGAFTRTACGESEAFVLVDGRLYVFRDGRNGQPDLLQAFLATVHIDGVPAPAGGRPSPSLDPLDPLNWTTYRSTRYTFGNDSTIGHPADWTVHGSDHKWTYKADGLDPLGTGQETFVNPEGNVRVGVWSVPRDPAEGSIYGTTSVEGWRNVEPWVQAYCERTGDTPCAGIHERAVPLCLEKRDCHPGLLVPFQDSVLAFFTNGGEGAPMTIVAVWRGPSDPLVANYGGSRDLLEAFLSTMDVQAAGESPFKSSRDDAASYAASAP